jgi:predicted RNase H-like HicB family nuclease
MVDLEGSVRLRNKGRVPARRVERSMTAVYYLAREGGYFGWIVGGRGIAAQGETADSVRASLRDQVRTILDLAPRQLPSHPIVPRGLPRGAVREVSREILVLVVA